MPDAGATWAGTHTFGAARLVVARSLDEVADVVAGTTGPIRALGTRHSFHDLADTAGTLVTLVEVPPDPELDEAAHTVTVSAGSHAGFIVSPSRVTR